MERVVGYIRVSTEQQTEKYGIARQETAIRAYCEKNRLELVNIYTDAGISGAMKDNEDVPQSRTQLLAMLDGFMEDETIEKVIVIKLDRLWRNSAAEEYICKRLRRLHIDIISVEESEFSLYTGDPAQVLTNRILAAIAEFDYANINKRMADGRAVKATLTGNKPAGRQPYGYKYDDDGRTTVLDPSEAPIVKELFRLRLNGMSTMEITTYFDEKGYINREGKPFSRTTLNYMLKNPFYCGVLTYAGQQIQGNHKAIVSRQDWQSLNQNYKLEV